MGSSITKRNNEILEYAWNTQSNSGAHILMMCPKCKGSSANGCACAKRQWMKNISNEEYNFIVNDLKIKHAKLKEREKEKVRILSKFSPSDQLILCSYKITPEQRKLNEHLSFDEQRTILCTKFDTYDYLFE